MPSTQYLRQVRLRREIVPSFDRFPFSLPAVRARRAEAFIYHLSLDGVERIEYEETEHYRVTRDFLLHPRRMLDVLLDRSDEGDEEE